MIGFDSFILMNDRSKDSTQCILDAYAQEGLVHLFDKHLGFRRIGQGRVFDACVNYLNMITTDSEQVWLATHDTDEFIWFNKTETTTSLKHVIQDMVQSRTNLVTNSLQVPRLMFGASGSNLYKENPVTERFDHRFNHEKCYDSQSQEQEQPKQSNIRRRRRRRLQTNEKTDNPHPKCLTESFGISSYDYYKSISLLPAMAQSCIETDNKTGKDVKVRCHNTHNHILKKAEMNPWSSEPFRITAETRESWSQRWKEDSRYVGMDKVGTRMVIAHYMTKSRQEFYERICESGFKDKYFVCPDCSPETFFNYSESYSNNDKDDRMNDFTKLLKERLKASFTGSHCETTPKHHSWEYYQNCWEKYIKK